MNTRIITKCLCLLIISLISTTTIGSNKMSGNTAFATMPQNNPLSVQILREMGHDDEYINKFLQIAEQANITLDPFLKGEVYVQDAELPPYSLEEQEYTKKELLKLIAQQFTARVTKTDYPTYTGCAGAPGTGKTYALEKMHDVDVAKQRFPSNAILIGPDSVALIQMDAFLNSKTPDERLAAYTKWRDASNFIANFMLVKAMTDGFNIVHDTTATSPKMIDIFKVLSNLHYYKNVHLYLAAKEDRQNALAYRSKTYGASLVTISDAATKANAAYEIIAYHKFKEVVNSVTIYVQPNNFTTTANSIPLEIAKCESSENNDIVLLPDMKSELARIISDIEENETFEGREIVIEKLNQLEEDVPKKKYKM